MAEVNLDVAMESTSQEILEKAKSIVPSVQKKCVASDNVVLTVINTEVSTPHSYGIQVGKTLYFKNICGTVRITVSLKSGRYDSDTYGAYISVENDRDKTIYGTTPVATQSYQTYTFDISVKDNDYVYFKLFARTTGNTVYCNLITIGFDVEAFTEDDCITVVG